MGMGMKIGREASVTPITSDNRGYDTNPNSSQEPPYTAAPPQSCSSPRAPRPLCRAAASSLPLLPSLLRPCLRPSLISRRLFLSSFRCVLRCSKNPVALSSRSVRDSDVQGARGRWDEGRERGGRKETRRQTDQRVIHLISSRLRIR